ncbi:hypothetical protein AB6A40_007413 [Gnathostoma spinigerum]|uniref:CRAL-TRIO domain-containing protein n=1 Tax=Gnathostoma spinigerum TaxID=75299 RepID=A0ABD6ETT2_9BILA
MQYDKDSTVCEFIRPSPLSADDIQGAKLLREKLKDIPQELNTDYYLARWWKSYDGDFQMIEKRFSELINHRRGFGYDKLPLSDLMGHFEIPRRTFERFCISNLASSQFSDNIAVFILRMKGNDLKEILRTIPLSFVIHSYFILQESFCRTVLMKEKITGKPASMVLVLDLIELNISELINPLSAPSKLTRLIVKVWADYFSEVLTKVFLINSPAIISIMWQITKCLMDKKTQARLQFLDHPSDLLHYLRPEAVPEEYGGQWRDDSGYACPPESACNDPVRVTPECYFRADDLWRQNGFSSVPKMTSATIKGAQTLEIFRTCVQDTRKLIWQFTVNGDIEFDVLRLGDDNQWCIVWPKVTLTSLKAPEQWYITCKKGEYKVRICNPTKTWLPIKINYAVEFGNDCN